MSRDEVLTKLRAHEAELRAEGIQSLYLFGSVARDDADADSDVDLLFDGAPPPTLSLLGVVEVKQRCEAILGVKVDFGERSAMRPDIRARVDPETLRVF